MAAGDAMPKRHCASPSSRSHSSHSMPTC